MTTDDLTSTASITEEPALAEESIADLSDLERDDGRVERAIEALGVEFRNRDLLRLALVHRSFLNERGADVQTVIDQSNERLEFLGDSLLGLFSAEWVYRHYPDQPEGVLTAAAMRCLNGEIFARLKVAKPEDEERCRAMGITDFKKIYKSEDLACGKDIVFAATGVTDGSLMKGVRFFGDGTRTESLIMQTDPRQVRFIDSIHVNDADDVTVRF